MIRITHSPIEQIIIHEMVEYTLPDFVKHMTLGVAPEGIASLVKWCDGIVHWGWLSYAEINSFKDFLESTNKARFPLIDVSNNDLNKDWFAG